MKLRGRSAWSLWVACVVAVVMLCNDPASAGNPRGATGTSGLLDGVNCSAGFLVFSCQEPRSQIDEERRGDQLITG